MNKAYFVGWFGMRLFALLVGLGISSLNVTLWFGGYCQKITREITQRLRAHTLLPELTSSSLSTHTRCLTTACNSSSRWIRHPWPLDTCTQCAHRYTYVHIIKNDKIFQMFKKIKSQTSEVTWGKGAHCQAWQQEPRPGTHVLEGEGQPGAALWPAHTYYDVRAAPLSMHTK